MKQAEGKAREGASCGIGVHTNGQEQIVLPMSWMPRMTRLLHALGPRVGPPVAARVPTSSLMSSPYLAHADAVLESQRVHPNRAMHLRPQTTLQCHQVLPCPSPLNLQNQVSPPSCLHAAASSSKWPTYLPSRKPTPGIPLLHLKLRVALRAAPAHPRTPPGRGSHWS